VKLSQALKNSLQELISIAGDEFSEIEVEKRLFGWKIRVSKGSAPQAVHVAQPAVAAALPRSSSSEADASSAQPESSVSGTPVLSPMVGTFYISPSPDADSFVQVGDIISIGQTVCIIEAMKIMNEIESEVAGRVSKVLVENGSPVEYNTPLFMVDPS
jgi:acetyl-CoA carboxylase biotin carboxyl carrier protein